ncbi:MAG: beta-N-acetylhexosaminidase [Deltaproteobacteria bacterium]|nr:beta-N-acetylhexosaminidase [Deltaproteobacteria bacterium]
MSKSISEIGRHFIVGIEGLELSATEKKILAELKPAGVILFKKNISPEASWKEKLLALEEDIKLATNDKDIWISIDHEGGKVHRFHEGQTTRFPEAMEWKSEVEQVAKTQGRELRELGFNLSFAPVLDVFSCEQNTVIARRAFACNAEEVIAQAKIYAQALEGTGVLACGKHFPGHGGTMADSHDQLPVLDKSKAQMLSCELAPFKAAAEMGFVKMLMTAHVFYSQLDAKNPATMSKAIINDLLRTELGYRGVVVSDALEMKALANLTVENVITQTLNAGVDILLVGMPSGGSALEVAYGMVKTMQTKLASGEINPAQLDSAAERIRQTLIYSRMLR